MSLNRRWALAPALLVALLVALALSAPARAACPIDDPDCGGPSETTKTITNTLTVTKATGTVTSASTPANTDQISCGADCTATSKQVVSCLGAVCDDPDPDGWHTFTLSASGGPSGYSPSWSTCGLAATCAVYLSSSRTITLSWVDTTNPSVALTVSSVSGKVGRTVQVSATASDNAGVSKVEWFIGASSTPALTRTPGQGLSGTLDLSALPEGPVTIRARATDTNGRVSSDAAQSFTLDKQVGLTVGGVPAFTRAATVPVSVATDPDAALTCAMTGGAPAACAGTYSPVTAATSDGTYTYTVVATDPVGNTATATRTFTLDRTLPVISDFDGPPEGSQVTTSEVTMVFQATDANLQGVTCRLDAAAPRPCAGSASLTGLADGVHRFTVTATDKAGNQTSKVRTFSVRTAAAGGGSTGGGSTGGGTTGGGTTGGGTTGGGTLAANPARLAYGYVRVGQVTRFPVLLLKRVPKGAKIKVTCTGKRKGCPRKPLVLTRSGRVKLTRYTRIRFRPGAVITVSVSKPGLKTKTVRITVRRGKAPKVR